MVNHSQPGGVESNQILLSEEQYHQISQQLELLRGKLKSQMVLFGDMNGQLISRKGELPGTDISILTALISSDFSATSEIARILGKNNQFRLHYHEGTNHHLYISSIGDQLFLAVIFDSSVTLGMVRIFTQKTIAKIEEIVQTGYNTAEQLSEIVSEEFKSFVNEGLDKILG